MKFSTSATFAFAALSLLPGFVHGYWLMPLKVLTTQRMDPIVNAGNVSGHSHTVVGGSNFGFDITTESLRQSECTSTPIKEDKSNYWFPTMYFHWKNGSFTSVSGGPVVYYLFDKKAPGTIKAFPPNFRILSGDPTLRTYDANAYGQQAIDYLCLDFNGKPEKFTSLPAKKCASGIRSQVNFPSCWDGKNLDSADHKSHVAFLSEGADKGSCLDPKFPVTIPRLFLEVYWDTVAFDGVRGQAMNPDQPFVFAYGDTTGYGNHADFANGWDDGALQRAVDHCTCNDYGDPQCCSDQGVFTLRTGDNFKECRITNSVDEQTLGTLPKLPGNNPVQPAGTRAKMYKAESTPGILKPVYVYTGNTPSMVGKVVIPPSTAPPSLGSGAAPVVAAPVPGSSASSVGGAVPAAPTGSSSVGYGSDAPAVPAEPASAPATPQPLNAPAPVNVTKPRKSCAKKTYRKRDAHHKRRAMSRFEDNAF